MKAKKFITTEVPVKALRPYQQEAFDLVWNRIGGKIENRALVVLATGLGKTVLAAALARKWFSQRTGRVLFLAHTTDILRQARKEFREVLHELTATGILTGDEFEGLDAHVLFATFQSMQNRLATTKPNAFGFVIVDEAHHGQAVTYKEVIEHFTPEFLIGMTATPDRHDGQDIRDIFGPELCSYPLVWGITEGWLSPVEYRLLTDNISIKRLREVIRQAHEGVRVSRKQIDATIFLPERTDRVVEIVRSVQAGGKRTIVFCRSIPHVYHVNEQFPEAVPYHSDIPFTTLRERFEAFHDGRIQTLLVIDKFNEGVDIPDSEVVVFLRGTDSMTLWLQQMGRGSRFLEWKEKLIILDFVANCRRIEAVIRQGLKPTIHVGESLPEPITVDTNLNITFSEEIIAIVGLLEFLDQGFYESYEEARAAVTKLNPPWEGNLMVWYKRNYRRAPRLPSNPYNFYKGKGWVGMWHFCGREFYSLEEARILVQSHNPPWRANLFTWYDALRKRLGNPRLPARPQSFYKGFGWVSWPHFCSREFYSYKETSALVQSHDPPWTENLMEWYRALRQRLGDPRLPSNPNLTYKDVGWVSWPRFCGREFYTFEEARALVVRHSLSWEGDVKTWYLTLRKRLGDPRLPSNPDGTYKDAGWVSWPHFCDRERYSFEEARALVQSHNPRGSLSPWYQELRKRLSDPRLHSNPYLFYKGKGWVSWPHFCGREKT